MTAQSFANDPGLVDLMQAILLEREPAARALHRWSSAADFETLSVAQTRLLGELAARIDLLDPDYPNRARLLGFQKYVWANNLRILTTSIGAVDALAQAGIDVLVLKGGGVIAMDPEAIRRRFVRDLDLMVHINSVPAAAHALFRAGWRPATGRLPGHIRAQPFARTFAGGTGEGREIEVDLHRGALHLGRNGAFDDAFFTRCRGATLLGRTVTVLADVDHATVSLLHGLSYDGEKPVGWAVDAVRALGRADFDWTLFEHGLAERKAGVAAEPVLTDLARLFNLPVPPGLASRLIRTPLAPLYRAEARAIGQTREQRGASGRLTMLLAEIWRCRALRRQVTYRTVLSRRMTSIAMADPPPPAGTVEISRRQDGRSSCHIEVGIGACLRRSAAFDVWQGTAWIARLICRHGRFSRRTVTGRWAIDLPLEDADHDSEIRVEAVPERR